MRRLTFVIITFVFVLCAAGAARAQAYDPCKGHPLPPPPPPDSPYYNDMKELPRGKWGLGDQFEKAQMDNPATPVVIRGLGSASSVKHRASKYSCVELENRTKRVVKSVQLRWSIKKNAAAPSAVAVAVGPVLAKGSLPVIEVEIQPGTRRKAEIRGAHYADFLKPLADVHGEVHDQYLLYVGVGRVEYADGTVEDLP
jgi:hypothetical protein